MIVVRERRLAFRSERLSIRTVDRMGQCSSPVRGASAPRTSFQRISAGYGPAADGASVNVSIQSDDPPLSRLYARYRPSGAIVGSSR